MSYIANDDGKYPYNATYVDNIFLEDYVQLTAIVEKIKFTLNPSVKV